MQNIINHFIELPFWQLTAVLLSVAYVVLVAQNNRWCWPAAFVSTLIFTIIFYDVSLLMESLLNLYYMAMAIFGWYKWQNAEMISGHNTLPIQRWSIKKHLLNIVSLLLISLCLGWLMENYTNADFAYLDTLTTVFAVATTYLVAIKLLENWLYWLVINTVSMYLYLQKGLEPTAFLALFNIIMCIVGFLHWSKSYRLQQRINRVNNPIHTLP